MAHSCDVLVVGDEVESILTAVSAARAGARVMLARRSRSRPGGLSVRGGLSYMDITPEYIAGLFGEFLRRAGVVRIALNPERAEAVLCDMLAEADIQVFSGVETALSLDGDGFPDVAWLRGANEEFRLVAKVVIDATPDADLARALGVPFITGLGGLLGSEDNFLGVSPVFRIMGASVAALRSFEADLRSRPDLPERLEKALPLHPPALRAEYRDRPTYAPDDMDYLDILNPVIGIDYHCWRHGSPDGYAGAGIAIDGANISRLSDGSLGFNGMVATAAALDAGLPELIAMSRDGAIPPLLLEEMRRFEQYLREVAGFSEAVVIPPESLYVRQTVTMLAKANMTARRAIAGGVLPERSVGCFSYWLDLRGVSLWKCFPGISLPKPVFNIGLDVALPAGSRLQNFAFVGRSAGYSPIGQGAGRIVQHNALLGEGLGVAAAMAAQENIPLTRIVSDGMPGVQAVLQSRGRAAESFSASPEGDKVISVEEAPPVLKDLLIQDEKIIYTHSGIQIGSSGTGKNG